MGNLERNGRSLSADQQHRTLLAVSEAIVSHRNKRRKIQILHEMAHGFQFEFRWSKSEQHFVGYSLENDKLPPYRVRLRKPARLTPDTEPEAIRFVRGYIEFDSLRPRQRKLNA
jgi:hypothetical protein